MSETFTNITIIKKANVYFGGNVSSRTILFPDGTRKTLGFMFPGEYEFNTASPETMEILDGEMDILLPETSSWLTIGTGQSFLIPANSKFKVILKNPVDYCCSYG